MANGLEIKMMNGDLQVRASWGFVGKALLLYGAAVVAGKIILDIFD